MAIANSKNTWVKPDGIDVTKTDVKDRDPRPEELADTKDAKQLPSGAVLSQEVDILALAALEDAVNDENVANVKAKIVVEIANGPVTQEAAEALFDKKVAVLPDVVANAGGVIVSCLEWQQNLKGEHWAESEVLDKMATSLSKASDDMLKRAKERSISLKQAAFENALTRLL